MAREDIYGTYGSVPEAASGGGGGTNLGVRATPQAFGSQVAGAVGQLGGVAQDISNKYLGMVNESLATQADADLAQEVGKLKGDYMSKTGKEAVDALPQFTNAVEAARQKYRKDLPLGAARAFDQLSVRSTGYTIGDANSYAATQMKQWQNATGAQLMATAALQAGDPYAAHDDQRFGQIIGDIKHGAGMQLPNGPGDGLSVHPETGAVSFDDTPQGQQLKSSYQGQIDQHTGQAWENRINTISMTDPLKASKIYADNKESIPADARVRIESTLAPKVINAYARGVVDQTKQIAAQDHQTLLTNSSATGSTAYNLGNVKTPSGAAAGTADFVKPATPVDGVVLAANTLRKGYQGLTLAQIANKWAPPSENQTSNWLKTVSRVSGIAPDAVPDMNNSLTLRSLLEGIGTAEKSAKDLGNFTSAVLDEGVSKALGGSEAQTIPQKSTPVVSQNYAQNPDGSPLTLADYYATHRDDIMARAQQLAQQNYPDNLEVRRLTRQWVEQEMQAAISAQNAQYRADKLYVQRGVTGALSDGKPPETYDELRSLPGMAPILDRVQVQDPQFASGIDTQISKMARRDLDGNSPNGYDTILRVLQPVDDGAMHPNRISSQDHLDKLLGRSDGTGINARDYEDGKKAIEYPDALKTALSKTMRTVANANGNTDGLGQQRAMDFYHFVTRMLDEKMAENGDLSQFTDKNSKDFLGQYADLYMATRETQTYNVARRMRNAAGQSASADMRRDGETIDQYLQRTGLQ